MVKGQVGMQVKIIGNCNSHGFKIGKTVKIASKYIRFRPDVGTGWICCSSTNSVRYIVCECDMGPVKAVIL